MNVKCQSEPGLKTGCQAEPGLKSRWMYLMYALHAWPYVVTCIRSSDLNMRCMNEIWAKTRDIMHMISRLWSGMSHKLCNAYDILPFLPYLFFFFFLRKNANWLMFSKRCNESCNPTHHFIIPVRIILVYMFAQSDRQSILDIAIHHSMFNQSVKINVGLSFSFCWISITLHSKK